MHHFLCFLSFLSLCSNGWGRITPWGEVGGVNLVNSLPKVHTLRYVIYTIANNLVWSGSDANVVVYKATIGMLKGKREDEWSSTAMSGG
jgi:hypothetical protein